MLQIFTARKWSGKRAQKINIQSGALECKGTSNCEELRVNIHIFTYAHTSPLISFQRLAASALIFRAVRCCSLAAECTVIRATLCWKVMQSLLELAEVPLGGHEVCNAFPVGFLCMLCCPLQCSVRCRYALMPLWARCSNSGDNALDTQGPGVAMHQIKFVIAVQHNDQKLFWPYFSIVAAAFAYFGSCVESSFLLLISLSTHFLAFSKWEQLHFL